jgi:hypothetical protein
MANGLEIDKSCAIGNAMKSMNAPRVEGIDLPRAAIMQGELGAIGSNKSLDGRDSTGRA